MSTANMEKPEIATAAHEEAQVQPQPAGKMTLHDFVTEEESLPKGHYRSLYLLGSFAAASLSQSSTSGDFAFIAPILGLIKADIGPSPNLVWTALVYNLGVAAGLLPPGRLTDLSNRPWFMIGGSVLGLIGSIICATANNINTLIGGEVFIGLGAATDTLYLSC
jgi:MFS family permease